MLQSRKSTPNSDNDRYGLKMRTTLKQDLEQFAERFDLDMSDVIRDGASALMAGYLPVLGDVPCGPLAESLAEVYNHEMAPPHLKPRPGDFFLEANGDSMSPRIERGDLVMIRPGIEAGQGEVCAVQMFDEGSGEMRSTLKRLFLDFENEEYELRPINPLYQTERFPKAKIQIVGVLRGLLVKSA